MTKNISRLIVLLAVLVALSSPSFAQSITFDTTFEKGSGGVTPPFSYVSNAGTVAGSIGANSNRCLIAVLGLDSILAVSPTMTWNSVSMTQIGSGQSLVSGYWIYMFGLTNPDTGAQTISASWTGANGITAVIGAVSVYNCTGWQNVNTATATSTAPSVAITSASGNMAIAGSAINNGAAPTIATGTSAWTELNFTGNYAQAYSASSGSSTTITWTTDNVEWGVIGVDVIASGTAVTRVGSLLLLFQVLGLLLILIAVVIKTPVSIKPAQQDEVELVSVLK